MKRVIKTVLAVVMVATLCVVASGCGTKTCDWCGETYTGDTYYRGITQSEMEMDACHDCAARYWAPLNVDNFKKS